MRTVSFTLRQNQTFEIFSKRRGEIYAFFEVWMVGLVKGERTVLDHFITHEFLERRFCYAKAGDLVWTDARESDIPNRKHKVAEQAKEVIARNCFIDLESIGHYFNSINCLPLERKVWNVAKKAILGCWTDGIATMTISPESKLSISCPPAASHSLYTAAYDYQADWWGFGSWSFSMMNSGSRRGEWIRVLRCDEHEFHISSGQRDQLAYVFHRVKSA